MAKAIATKVVVLVYDRTNNAMINKNKNKNKVIAESLIDKAFKLYPDWPSVDLGASTFGPRQSAKLIAGRQSAKLIAENEDKTENEQPLNLPKPVYPPKLAGVDISKKQMAQVPLDEISKSVICGTIFADSSFKIDKGYANARFQARHSTRQYTWFMWKYLVILKEFTNKTGVIFQAPDGYQVNSLLKPGEEILGKLKIASKADPKLTELHKVICVNNKKTVKRSWLNHMNNYFLMTVWLDDGSLYNNRQGLISFNSTPMLEQNIFREYLLNVWEIETKLQDTGKVMNNGQINYRITIDNIDSLLKLLRLVAPVIPVREMLYKVCFVPENDPSLLQRWKSELLGLVRPEFHQDIDDFYKNL